MSCILKFFFETRPFQVRIGSDNHGEPQTAQCGTDPMVRGGKATGSPGSRLSGRKMAWESFKKGLFIANFIVRVQSACVSELEALGKLVCNSEGNHRAYTVEGYKMWL